MKGWIEDVKNWPIQCATRINYQGQSYLLYLNFRGTWRGWIIEGAIRLHDLSNRSLIWSEEMLCGCRISNLRQAKIALVRVFKQQLGINNRLNLIQPKIL
jgi:hypothetical protein